MNTTPAKVGRHSKTANNHNHNPGPHSNGRNRKPIPIPLNNHSPNPTARELQILCEIARNLTPKAISRKYDISPRTVEKHEQNLRKKFHAHTRKGVVRKAVKSGIITLVLAPHSPP